MYIINDIAYAGEKEKPIKICGVRPLNDYKLWLRFNNGEARIYDCKPLMQSPAFQPLKDPAVFRDVYIDYGVVVWMDGDLDVAPEAMYRDSVAQDERTAG